MPNFNRRDFSVGWNPSADGINADPRALLRADNVAFDEEGIVSLRPGSAKINGSALADLDLHSLHTAVIGGTRYRIFGAGNKAYSNNTDIGVTFAGSGDISMSNGFGQAFLARSTTKKKWSGTAATNWGMARPAEPPSVEAIDQYAVTIATCDTGESPAFVVNEGSKTTPHPDGADGTANGSIEIQPSSAGRITITKTFTSNQNLMDIMGIPGDDRDIFDMLAWVQEPDKIDKITIKFGMGTKAADAFDDDYYSFDFNFGTTKTSTVVMNEPRSLAKVAADLATQKDPTAMRAEQEGVAASFATRSISKDLSADDVSERFTPGTDQEKRRERKDAASNPGWTHYSCLRGQFSRLGNTSTKNWRKIRAVKIIFKMAAGTTSKVRFDTVRWVGGSSAGAIVGSFRFRYRAVKDYTTFAELSTLSGPSNKVEFVGQRARITVPRASLLTLDSQADTLWFYGYGGVLDRWYRFGVSPTIAKTAFRIDEFARTPDGTISATDRARFTGFGFSVPTTYTTPTEDVVIDITTNEIEAMFINEHFNALETLPPDNIVDIVPEYYERFFVLAQESGQDGFVYISDRRRPGIFKYTNALRIGNSTETLHWIRKTLGGLYIGTSREIYRLSGNADELPDGTLDLALEALNIESPPVDKSVATEGNKIIYRAKDGYRIFDGVSSEPVPREAVELLHRGQTRYGVSPLNLTTGRFRSALSNNQLWTLAPEGASTTSTAVLYKVDFNKGRWHRYTYPSAFTCIAREPDGTVIAGDSSGFVRVLESGTDDAGTAIAPVVWTKIDDDSWSLQKKDPFDLSLQIDTGNTAATVAIHLDNSGSVATNGNLSVTANGHAFYKKNISDIASFRHFQLRISGSLPTFKLYSFNVGYRIRPQQRMYVDTGTLPLAHDQDITWERSIQVCVNTTANLTVTPYFDDVAFTASTITATANKVVVYEVPLGREIKGGAPRITIATASAAGTTEPLGFELYWMKLFYRPSGNEKDKKTLKISGDEV